MFAKSALVAATAAAIALTSFDLRPAQAAPEGGPAVAKQHNADEFSAQRKRRRGRGVHPGVPLAAFGAIVGTIATIAAAERRREYYERPYYGGYGGPYAYEAPYGYGYAPQVYAPRAYGHPGYGHHGYGRQGFSAHPRGAYGQQGDGAPAAGQSPAPSSPGSM